MESPKETTVTGLLVLSAAAQNVRSVSVLVVEKSTALVCVRQQSSATPISAFELRSI